MNIRPASLNDAALLAALHAQCFDEAWDEPAFATFLCDSLTFALIAEEGCAFILIRGAADECEILSLGTHPKSRRSGLARALLRAGAEEARRRGARRMFLEVAADNGPALALYSTMGFSPTGRRPYYYIRGARNAADAVILSAALPF